VWVEAKTVKEWKTIPEKEIEKKVLVSAEWTRTTVEPYGHYETTQVWVPDESATGNGSSTDNSGSNSNEDSTSEGNSDNNSGTNTEENSDTKSQEWAEEKVSSSVWGPDKFKLESYIFYTATEGEDFSEQANYYKEKLEKSRKKRIMIKKLLWLKYQMQRNLLKIGMK
jgi:hypothetical protein